MATPEGPNVYDTNGTVLYRVLSRDDHELKVAGSGPADPGGEAPAPHATDADSILVGGGMSIATKYGPLAANKIRTVGSKKPRKLVSLSAYRSGADDRSTTSAQHLTVEKALSELFPPAPLEQEAEPDAPSVAVGKGLRPLLAASRSRRNPWLKVAAADHTSRLDVVQLHQHLQRRCADEHARMRGVLCPIRENIFNDGLLELTRQITVMCPERGLLLKDLNECMAQATETYDILFDSACQYAVRKSIERDLSKYLFEQKKELESEVRRLDNRVNELRAKHDGMLKRFEEQKAVNAKLHEEEINYMKKANQQLISEIKRLVAMENQK